MAEEWVDPGRRTYLPHLGVDPIRFSLRQSPRVDVCMGTDVAIPNLESAVFCANESEKLVSCLFIAESTQHGGRYCRGVLLFDPTHHHAEMSCFNDYPTPSGWSAPSIASAICVVSRSCTCNRRANTSTRRGTLLSPITFPAGIYAT